MSGKELLTAAEAADKIRIAKRTLLRWARENKIESVRVSNKKILFTEQAIERFLQARTHGIELGTVKKNRADRKPERRKTNKGGGKETSGEMWRGLRKEVHKWA
jgi:excisionase family DNA binding protein